MESDEISSDMGKIIRIATWMFLITVAFLLPKYAHAAIVTTHYATDPAMQNIPFEAEGRIGDRGGAATFELDIGPTTATPAQTAQYAWRKGVTEPFILTYNNITGVVSFTVGEKILTYIPVTPITVSSDIYILTRATSSFGMTSSSIVLNNLVLNGIPVVDSSTSSYPGGGLDILEISGENLAHGFTLTRQ